MKKSCLCLLFIFFSCSAAFSQDSLAYKKSLQKLMEVTGAQKTFGAAVDQMLVMFRQQKPMVPEQVWADFGKTFRQAAREELLDIMLPIYYKHLSADDLNAAILFYESPAGKRFAEASPVLVQESMAAGQMWGRKIGNDFMEQLKGKGY